MIIDRIKSKLKILHSFIWKFRLSSFGKGSYIDRPLKIEGKKNISIGSHVQIQYNAWLAAVPLTGSSLCQLLINDGVILGNYNHIYATESIEIGKDVLLADKVYISDNIHDYNDITKPIHSQPILQKSRVVIGQGSWIGENVCIIGASIGRNCVIGANSVVTKSIPDFCVAVGSPARIIKQYNPKTGSWEKTY